MDVEQDAVDRLLLREAGPHLRPGTTVAVLEDVAGALTLGVTAALAGPDGGPGGGAVRTYNDALAEEREVVGAVRRAGLDVVACATLQEAVRGADLVLLRLPKSLAALDEVAEAAARAGGPTVRLIGGERIRHLNRSMNEVLGQHFAAVRASLGQQKCRALIAEQPRPAAPEASYPRQAWHADLGLTVCAHGPAFAGTSVDAGTRFLLGFLGRLPADARRVVDLGCGTGVLAVGAARTLPGAAVLAVDESRAAVASARATAAANDLGPRITVRRAARVGDLAECPPHSVDVVLCNPPFHRGTARDSSPAFGMFDDAGRVLRPGGELWTVYNSHLPYLTALRRVVGPTTLAGQDPRYTVTRSVKID